MPKNNISEIIFDKLLNFIAYKSRTEVEVEKKFKLILKNLTEKRFSCEDPDLLKNQIIEKIRSLGFLDDLEYAKTYVKEKIEGSKPVSKRYAQSFLIKKGVSKDTINIALKDAYFDPKVEIKVAEKLLDKKLRTLGKNVSVKAKQKLIRYLLGKGFSPDIVFPLVDTKIKLL